MVIQSKLSQYEGPSLNFKSTLLSSESRYLGTEYKSMFLIQDTEHRKPRKSPQSESRLNFLGQLYWSYEPILYATRIKPGGPKIADSRSPGLNLVKHLSRIYYT